MKVFLSYALPPYDNVLPSRLRAVALGYNVELLLPNADERDSLSPKTKQKIKQSKAVIALVANNVSQVEAVNLELQEAVSQNIPIVALVENRNLVKNIPSGRIVVINRLDPTMHEAKLFQVLNSIETTQRGKEELVRALGALGLVALGLYAFGELTKD